MFEVRRTWLRHEGGTKFHQSFEIAQAGSKPGVTIFNFGAIRPSTTTPFSRPITNGQIQIKAMGRYGSQIAKKMKEGYHRTEPERALSFGGESGFRDFLVAEFGASKTNEILIAMGIPASGSPVTVTEEPDPSPTVEREDTPIDKFAGRPAAWGSW